MLPTSSFPVAFLVELLDPFNGDVLECDVCAKLELAVEKVQEHFSTYPGLDLRVEVSVDDDGELEGIGFFDSGHEIVSCVTVYHLERDDGEAQSIRVQKACRAPLNALERHLNQLFSS